MVARFGNGFIGGAGGGFFLILRVRFGKGTGNDEKYVLRGKIMEMLLLFVLVLPPSGGSRIVCECAVALFNFLLFFGKKMVRRQCF